MESSLSIINEYKKIAEEMKKAIDRSRIWIICLNIGVLVLFLVGVILEFTWTYSLSITWPILQYIYSIVFLVALIRIRSTIKDFDEVALNQCYLAMHYMGVLLINITGTIFSISCWKLDQKSAQDQDVCAQEAYYDSAFRN